MRALVASTNLLLGVVYTGYGIITAIDLRRGWHQNGFSPFGVAWIFMAFTCGPHHFEHGIHAAVAGRHGGPLDFFAVLVGLPAGATWILLRIEALRGGRGDRFIAETPARVRVAASAITLCVVATIVTALVVAVGGSFDARMAPNLLLVHLYLMIGWYLARTQFGNRPALGGWSLSGLTLTAVFPTCAAMHAAFAAYLVSGRYSVDVHGLVIDWLSVPASVYFLWVTRSLHLGVVRDWNRSATGVTASPPAVAA